MSAARGKAAYFSEPRPEVADHRKPQPLEHFDDQPWRPNGDVKNPALDLQRQVYNAVVTDREFQPIPVPPLEQALRSFSRVMGYVSLVGTVALIGWLVV
jgi:hypothetical protein